MIWKIIKYTIYATLIYAVLTWILEFFGFVESYDDRQARLQREKLLEQIEDDTSENIYLECKGNIPQSWQSYYLLDKPIERIKLIRLIKRLDDSDYTFYQIYEIYNQRVIKQFYDDAGTYSEENLFFLTFPEEVPKGLFFPSRDGVYNSAKAGIQIYFDGDGRFSNNLNPIDVDTFDDRSSLTLGGTILNREKLTISSSYWTFAPCEVFQTDNFDLYAESLDKEAKQTSIDFLSSKYLELKKESDDWDKKRAKEQEEKNKI